MAHRKAGGSAKNLRDSNPKYLGVKLYAGEHARPGAIIIRQRGTQFVPGENVGIGRDHSLFATAEGTVLFSEKRVKKFDGTTSKKKVVSVTAKK